MADWAGGMASRHHAAGTFGDTPEEKAAAGLSPTPTIRAVKLDPDTAAALNDYFRQLAEDLNVLYGTAISLVEDLAALFTQFSGGLAPLDPRARARAAHRRCPRHGPAPGGLCRPCARSRR